MPSFLPAKQVPRSAGSGEGEPAPADHAAALGLISSLLAGKSLDEAIPLDAVPPLEGSPVPASPDRLAASGPGSPPSCIVEDRVEYISTARERTATNDVSLVPGELAVLIDVEPDADTIVRETDEFLTQKGLVAAGSFVELVAHIRSGGAYTYEAIWSALPGLATQWNEHQFLVLDALTTALGRAPELEGRTYGAPASPALIIEAVCCHFGTSPNQVCAPSGDGDISLECKLAMYLLWQKTPLGSAKIGRLLRQRTGTVRATWNQVQASLQSDTRMLNHVAAIEELLAGLVSRAPKDAECSS